VGPLTAYRQAAAVTELVKELAAEQSEPV